MDDFFKSMFSRNEKILLMKKESSCDRSEVKYNERFSMNNMSQSDFPILNGLKATSLFGFFNSES